MNVLRVRFFGSVELTVGDRLVGAFTARSATSLFAYLVLNRDRLVARDVLCGALWGDRTDADARKALRTALWRVRQVLEPFEDPRRPFLQVERGRLGLTGSERVWSDVWEFDERLRAVAHSADQRCADVAAELNAAASLYRGDLLEGCYDDWCTSHRERLRLAFLEALERLVEYHRVRKEWREVIAWGQRILRVDPFREHVYRRLMESYVARGDRPAALLQYQTCLMTLSEELGIEPMAETQQLHEEIRNGVSAPLPVAAEAPMSGELERLTRSVSLTLRDLQTFLVRLDHARDGFRPVSSANAAGSGGAALINSPVQSARPKLKLRRNAAS